MDEDIGAVQHQQALPREDAPQEVGRGCRLCVWLCGPNGEVCPGGPQRDWPGHGLVRPQGRAGQSPPLGAQRRRGTHRWLLIAVEGVQLVGVPKHRERGCPDVCWHETQRGLQGSGQRRRAGAAGWPAEAQCSCDAGARGDFLLRGPPSLLDAVLPFLAPHRRPGLGLPSPWHFLPSSYKEVIEGLASPRAGPCPPPPESTEGGGWGGARATLVFPAVSTQTAPAGSSCRAHAG